MDRCGCSSGSVSSSGKPPCIFIRDRVPPGFHIWTCVWRLLANEAFINIFPSLQEYRGDRTKLKATIEVYVPNTNIRVENRTVNLSPAGYINTTVSAEGTYDVRIRIPGFLSLLIHSYSTASTYVTDLIRAGDVNGNNAVDTGDLFAVQTRLNQYWTGPEDVDGDGRVTTHDLMLVQKNQGAVGN